MELTNIVLAVFTCAVAIAQTCQIDKSSLTLFNGEIHTMNENSSVESVVAIRNGKIAYVGNSLEEAQRGFGQSKTIDLGGRMATPGLIDSHNHIVLLGNRPGYHTPLENAYSIQEVLDVLNARAKDVPEGQFITTIGGFHPNQFEERRLPTLNELDNALPRHPVFISYGFAGPGVTNSLGRKIFGNSSLSAGIENGRALLALRKNTTREDRKRSVNDAMKYAVFLGVTTHIDQGAFPATGTPTDSAASEDLYAMHLPWLEVFQENPLIRLRTNFIQMDDTIEVPTLQQRLQNSWKFFGNDMLRTGGIGEFISGTNGTVFGEAARRIAMAGWRAEVHSLSDTDFKEQVQVFEKVNQEVSLNGLRWVIAHVPRITKEYLERLKKLGGGVNLSSWQYLAGSGPNAGPPFKDILETGIHAGMGGDGMNIAPMNPWVHAYFATTGKNALGDQINKGQQITRADVLRMYMKDNRWSLGGPDEELLGTIEVGRLGDVVVLNNNYFKVDDERLKRLSAVLTIVGGEVVYSNLK